VTWVRLRAVEIGCLGLGVAILAVTVWTIGAQTLVGDLRTIGWSLAGLLMVESLSVLMNTAGWAMAFPPGERPVSAVRLLGARLAGDAVNYLTPSATVGGELLRVRLLGPDVAPSLRWASVSAAKIGQSVAQAVFLLLGVAIVIPDQAVTRGWLGAPGTVVVAVLAGAGALASAVAFVRAVDRGFWVTARDTLRWIKLGWLLPASWAGTGHDVDAALARVGRWRSVGLLACFVAGWAVGALEIYLILRAIGVPVGWKMALALETGAVLIDGILFFVPGKVGTQEGGKVVLFAALGLDPVRGLTVGVVRRIRELAYAVLGLLALGWVSTRAGAGSVLRPTPASSGGPPIGHV
jgi:uncharacterized membrane protein YbhN (UPF0104 family)